jgi:DNA polymerase-3 subunit alpha
MYISGHPLEEYENKWKKNITKTAKDFALNEENQTMVTDGVKETIGGMISDITVKVTKTNNVMAFITIEDLYGTVEVLVFPKFYEKFRNLITEDNKVFVTGRVTANDDENAKLICDNIVEFGDINSTLWIRFENKQEYEEKSELLLDKIKDSDGKDKIGIFLKEEKARKILPNSYSVNADTDTVELLKKTFGAENVAVV